MSVPTSDEINDAIATDALTGIQSATVDGRSATAMSVDDRIRAQEHVAGQAAAASSVAGFGIRFQKIVPPAGG